jgi:hypothetical protein
VGAVVRCLLPDLPIVEMVVDGILTAEEGAQSMGEGMRLSAENGVWATLADFTHMRRTASGGDIVALADAAANAGLPPEWCEAIILPIEPNAAVWAQLWEAAAVNRGLKVKSFHDREDAIAWLLAQDALA